MQEVWSDYFKKVRGSYSKGTERTNSKTTVAFLTRSLRTNLPKAVCSKVPMPTIVLPRSTFTGPNLQMSCSSRWHFLQNTQTEFHKRLSRLHRKQVSVFSHTRASFERHICYLAFTKLSPEIRRVSPDCLPSYSIHRRGK